MKFLLRWEIWSKILKLEVNNLFVVLTFLLFDFVFLLTKEMNCILKNQNWNYEKVVETTN